jgi:hypothetical protein
MIHIARDRQQLGQFTEDEVAEGLKSGRFLPTDLAWREHMPAWIPLGEFDDLPNLEAATLDLPPPILEVVGENPASPSTLEPAWERSAELGLLASISRTISEVLLNPTRTFAAMTQTGGLRVPLIYYLILGIVGTEVSLAYRFVMALINPSSVFPEYKGEITTDFILMSFAGFAILAPLLVAAGAFVSSSVFHISLMALGSAKKPFEATFRVFCYAAGSAMVFQLIPLCGEVIQPVWAIICLIIGLRQVHQIELPMAIAAVVLPVLLCCGAVFGLFFVAGMAGAIR